MAWLERFARSTGKQMPAGTMDSARDTSWAPARWGKSVVYYTLQPLPAPAPAERSKAQAPRVPSQEERDCKKEGVSHELDADTHRKHRPGMIREGWQARSHSTRWHLLEHTKGFALAFVPKTTIIPQHYAVQRVGSTPAKHLKMSHTNACRHTCAAQALSQSPPVVALLHFARMVRPKRMPQDAALPLPQGLASFTAHQGVLFSSSQLASLSRPNGRHKRGSHTCKKEILFKRACLLCCYPSMAFTRSSSFGERAS